MIGFCKVVPVWMGSALVGAVVAAMPTSGSFAQSGPVSDPVVAAIDETRFAFLSRRQDGSPSEEMIPSLPEQDRADFDGRWIFTSAGCRHTGSLPATIRKGQITIAGGGGFVSPDGTLHSVGAGGGMTLTAVGQ